MVCLKSNVNKERINQYAKTDISAKGAKAQKSARFSCSDGKQGGTGSGEGASA